jgi:hypothetical protein
MSHLWATKTKNEDEEPSLGIEDDVPSLGRKTRAIVGLKTKNAAIGADDRFYTVFEKVFAFPMLEESNQQSEGKMCFPSGILTHITAFRAVALTIELSEHKIPSLVGRGGEKRRARRRARARTAIIHCRFAKNWRHSRPQ